MARRNNINDMTVREQIEGIKADFCECICKHYAAALEQRDAVIKKGIRSQDERSKIYWSIQAELDGHCDNCPLSRL